MSTNASNSSPPPLKVHDFTVAYHKKPAPWSIGLNGPFSGVAAPIGLTGASPDIGVFLYLSFDHNFRPKKQ